MSYRELLAGCGNNRKKKITCELFPDEWSSLTTLDIDDAVGADVIHDLAVTPYPFDDNSFDEIHAYECIEHFGRQGDWKGFLEQFGEFYRILKPGGLFVATVPMWDSPWAWGDIGHTRVIPKESLIYLRRGEYEQLGKTAMTDYRRWLKCDFETLVVSETEHQMAFILKALK